MYKKHVMLTLPMSFIFCARGTKFLFPMHSLVSANKAFTITEGDDIENKVKYIQPWTDVCTFKISPIIESRKLLALE